MKNNIVSIMAANVMSCVCMACVCVSASNVCG
jgi:hypothetical protein